MSMELLTALGQASLSAAVMILAVMILRLRFQDRTPRRAFCLLWDLVLVRLLMPVDIPSPVSIRRWLPELATAPATVHAVHPQAVSLMDGTALVREVYVTPLAEDAACTLSSSLPALPRPDWNAVLLCLWLGAALLLAGGFLWSHLRSRRIYASSLPCRDGFVLDWLAAHPLRRPVQARVSDRVAAPLTYGVLYPVILLPSGMDWRDRETLSCVLAHEHTHIRRFDPLRKVFLAAALCLHWFNPMAWAMYVLANRDMELSCDEAVLRSGADRERYALALLNLEERRGRWSPSGSHFSGHALEERIKAIMKRKHISITALIAVLVVMSITTTVFASAAPEDAPSELPRQDQNAPVTAYVETEKDDSVMMMSNGENGEKLYSVDNGRTWMSEERYHAEYGSWGDDWQVEWWTYEEYKAWLEQEKKDLQEVIGSKGWTPSTGWFTWDQEKVDETIAMYEGILEDIKNGALYSKTIIDRNGNEVEDAMLGSDAPLEMVIASTFDESNMVSVAPKTLDEAALLEELKAFGIGGNANLMTYNGQLIRTFVDGAPVGDSGYSVQYVYTNPDGVVDVHTLRSVIYNPDGSYDTMGDLIGVAAKGDAGFDQVLIEAAAFNGNGTPQVTASNDAGADPYENQNSAAPANGIEATTAEGTGEHGKSFEEIFARYEEYGLTYLPRESGMGALIFNGQPVRSFADLKPDGGAFSYADSYAGEDGLTVYAQYDQDGKLMGLAVEPAPLKAYRTEKQDLGFDYCTPVQGRLSAAFGQGSNQFHYGVDLAAAKGTDVAAFADGTVSEVGFDSSLGNYIVLSHANGYSTLYAHCSSVAVSEGSSVAMGEKIAEVGVSGRATGAVLHFELRDGDTYLDPGQYLAAAALT
ncbi:MAG: peptidoglycan DD-metalloendopeptidase family protein [Oscillospiraceae bacterium]|nr:peptidoglycan DD-metalloendopeptidase family protein [Oscillospiraceae bacterium]